jgi:hypothetical protein
MESTAKLLETSQRMVGASMAVASLANRMPLYKRLLDLNAKNQTELQEERGITIELRKFMCPISRSMFNTPPKPKGRREKRQRRHNARHILCEMKKRIDQRGMEIICAPDEESARNYLLSGEYDNTIKSYSAFKQFCSCDYGDRNISVKVHAHYDETNTLFIDEIEDSAE